MYCIVRAIKKKKKNERRAKLNRNNVCLKIVRAYLPCRLHVFCERENKIESGRQRAQPAAERLLLVCTFCGAYVDFEYFKKSSISNKQKQMVCEKYFVCKCVNVSLSGEIHSISHYWIKVFFLFFGAF